MKYKLFTILLWILFIVIIHITIIFILLFLPIFMRVIIIFIISVVFGRFMFFRSNKRKNPERNFMCNLGHHDYDVRIEHEMKGTNKYINGTQIMEKVQYKRGICKRKNCGKSEILR